MKKSLIILILLVQFFLSSCGSISKPWFRPSNGQIDYKIVFLDSLGLAFFVVPGLVAFSIDYITGTLFIERNAKDDYDDKNEPSPILIRELILKNNPNLTDKEIDILVHSYIYKYDN